MEEFSGSVIHFSISDENMRSSFGTCIIIQIGDFTEKTGFAHSDIITLSFSVRVNPSIIPSLYKIIKTLYIFPELELIKSLVICRPNIIFFGRVSSSDESVVIVFSGEGTKLNIVFELS